MVNDQMGIPAFIIKDRVPYYEPGMRATASMEAFRTLHSWVLTDPPARPRFGPDRKPLPPRRFVSEEAALDSRLVSGGEISQDRSLAVIQAESQHFLNPMASEEDGHA